jgi:hypothetical protein
VIRPSRDPSRRRSASAALACLARLDRCPPGRLELLLQAARSEDHASRVDPARRYGRWLCYCVGSAKRVNPVGPKGRGTSLDSVVGSGALFDSGTAPHNSRRADANRAGGALASKTKFVP